MVLVEETKEILGELMSDNITWTFDSSFLFIDKETIVKEDIKEVEPVTKDNLVGEVKRGTPVKLIEDGERKVIALCPQVKCSYKTLGIYNSTGALKTMESHIKHNHRVKK